MKKVVYFQCGLCYNNHVSNKPPHMKQLTEKEKELEKFAKDYKKLMQKYPDIMVGGDINGDPIAYILDVRQTKEIKL